MPGGNVSDCTLSLETFDRFSKAAAEKGAPFSVPIFTGDCHHDSYAHYRYFDMKKVDTVIPLSGNSKKVSVHLPGRGEVRLDADGTPLCPAGKPMRYRHFNKRRQTRVFVCPAKRVARRDGKRVFVFHREDCPNREDCMPDSNMGPFVYIKPSDDPRMYYVERPMAENPVFRCEFRGTKLRAGSRLQSAGAMPFLSKVRIASITCRQSASS